MHGLTGGHDYSPSSKKRDISPSSRNRFGLNEKHRGQHTMKQTISILGLAMTLVMNTTHAQVLEEITVTAQKREQSLQDVGIAVTAFSGEQLETLGIQTSTDISLFTPGVSVAGSYGGQMQTYSIRGVTQYEVADHTESPNAVYIDEGYVAMMQGQRFATFDIERIEILKGPQGTLFGRNATGGTINVVTRQPTTSLDGYVDLRFGDYNHTRLEAALSGPLTDTVSARVALLHNKHDEILNNVFPGAENEWNDDTVAARLRVLLEPSDTFSALVSAYSGRSEFSTSPYQSRHTIAEVDANGTTINSYVVADQETREGIGPGGVNADVDGDGIASIRPVPGGDFFGFKDPDGDGFTVSKNIAASNTSELESYGATAKLTWLLGDLELVSLSDYKANKKDFILDYDAAPVPFFHGFAVAEIDHFSQEIRLSGQSDRTQWVAGLYYLDIDSDIPYTGFIVPALATPEFRDSFKLQTRSVSVFGQMEFVITDTTRLVSGLRYVDEKKDFAYRTDFYDRTLAFEPEESASFIANFRQYEDDLNDSFVAGKLQIEFTPSDDWLLYVGYNRGVKAGSFNAPLGGSAFAFIPDEEFPYDREQLNAYEVGFKSTFFGGRSRLNGAAYFYDYKDYQAFKVIGVTTQVINTDATTQGVELEFVSSPVDGLDLMLAMSWMDMNVENVSFDGIVADRKNAYTPEIQATAVIRYEWRLGPGYLAAQLDGSYTDKTFYSLSNFNSTKVRAYTIANARASYLTQNENWEFSVFVKNLADERYESSGFDLSTFCGCSETGFGNPRWWGASARYRFGD